MKYVVLVEECSCINIFYHEDKDEIQNTNYCNVNLYNSNICEYLLYAISVFIFLYFYLFYIFYKKYISHNKKYNNNSIVSI